MEGNITINGDVNINLTNCNIYMGLLTFHGQSGASALQEFTFQTNAAGGDTFDPSITYGGGDTPKWIFEDASELTGSSISTLGSDVGLDGTTQTVTLQLADLTQITALDFSLDSIITCDLTTLTSLTSIILTSNTGLTSCPLPNLVGCTELNLSACSGLTSLDVSNSTFSSCSFNIASTSALTTFTKTSASGSFSSFLAGSSGLTSLDLSGFTMSGGALTLSSMASLTTLNLPDSGTISTLNLQSSSAITTFDGGTTLDLSSFTITEEVNCLSTTNIAGVTLGSNITLGNNKVLTFQNDSITGYVDMTNLSFDTGAFSINMRTNAIASATDINHMLVDLDALLGAGTASLLFQGGTNAAPDGSSGGYDGSAAKTSLQGKGYTVITN